MDICYSDWNSAILCCNQIILTVMDIKGMDSLDCAVPGFDFLERLYHLEHVRDDQLAYWASPQSETSLPVFGYKLRILPRTLVDYNVLFAHGLLYYGPAQPIARDCL